MKLLFLLVLSGLAFPAFSQHSYLLVGTYTTGKSKGIYVYDFNGKDGTAKAIDSVKTSNPSFLAVSPNQQFVYAVFEKGNNEGGGEVSAFRFDKKQQHLIQLN